MRWKNEFMSRQRAVDVPSEFKAWVKSGVLGVIFAVYTPRIPQKMTSTAPNREGQKKRRASRRGLSKTAPVSGVVHGMRGQVGFGVLGVIFEVYTPRIP